MKNFSPKEYFKQQILPEIPDNKDLEMKIQTLLQYYNSNIMELRELIQDFNASGQSRQIQKKSGNFSNLMLLLKEDIEEYVRDKQMAINELEKANNIINSFINNQKTENLELVLRNGLNNSNFEDIITSHEVYVNKLQMKMKDLNEKLIQSESEKGDLEVKLTNLNNKLEEITEKHEENISLFEKQLKEKINETEQKNLKEKEEIHQQYEFKLDTLKLNYEIKIQEIEKELFNMTEKSNQLLTQKNQYFEEMLGLQKQKEKHNIEIKRLSFINTQQSSQIVQLNQQISQLRVLKESSDRQNESYRITLEDITSDHQNLQIISKKQSEEFSSQIKYLQSTIIQLKESHQLALKKFESFYENKICEYEKETQNHLLLYKQKFMRKIKIITDQIELQFLQKYGVQVQEILNKKFTPTEQDDNFDFTYDELKKQFLEKVEQLERLKVEKSDESIQTELVSYKEMENKITDKIDARYKELFMQMGDDYHNSMMKFQAQQQKDLKEIKESYEQMFSNLQSQKDEVEKELQLSQKQIQLQDEKLIETATQLEVAKQKLDFFEEEINNQNNKFASLNGLLKEKDENLIQLKQQKKKLKNELEKTTIQQQQIKNDYETKTQSQKQDIEKKVKLLLESKQQLQNKLLITQNDLRKLKEIEQNQKQYQMKSEELQYQLTHAQQKAEYFQRELENYKNVYNIFQPRNSKNERNILDNDQIQQQNNRKSNEFRFRTINNSIEDLNKRAEQNGSLIEENINDQSQIKVKLKKFTLRQYSDPKKIRGLIPHFQPKRLQQQNYREFGRLNSSLLLSSIYRLGEKNRSLDEGILNEGISDSSEIRINDLSNPTTIRNVLHIGNKHLHKQFGGRVEKNNQTIQIQQIELTQQLAAINKKKKKDPQNSL